MGYDFRRNALVALPHGGICFHAKPILAYPSDHRLFLGFSICPDTELFNRSVAKRLAEANLDWLVSPKSFAIGDIIENLFEDPCEALEALACLSDAEYNYERLHELKIAIDKVVRSNESAAEQLAFHQEAIKSLKLKERYNELQS
jgi:hypothetical protein